MKNSKKVQIFSLEQLILSPSALSDNIMSVR